MNQEQKKNESKREALNNESLQDFIENHYKDEKLKANGIAELNRIGFRAFIKKHFSLTAYQEKGLDSIKDTDVESMFTKAVVTTLHRNGKIELVHEGIDLPNMSISLKTSDAHADLARANGNGNIDIKIGC